LWRVGDFDVAQTREEIGGAIALYRNRNGMERPGFIGIGRQARFGGVLEV